MDAKSAVEITPVDNFDNISELLHVKVKVRIFLVLIIFYICISYHVLDNITVLSIVSQYTQ